MPFGRGPDLGNRHEDRSGHGRPHDDAVACWLYVSRSTLGRSEAETEVSRIVTVSLQRNPRLQVTGALIFTGGRFAQYLEGPLPGLAELRASVERDPRHCEITTLLDADGIGRRFGAWSLAYAGPALYVSRAVERPLMGGRSDRPAGADQLIQLMREFARAA